MADRVFFGILALLSFAVSVFGRSLVFRWGDRSIGPIMPNWFTSLFFALFGVFFVLLAVMSK